MNNITKKEAIERLARTNGRVFNAVYTTRKSGAMCQVNARLGVRKGVKGVGRSFDPASKGLLGIYKMGRGGGHRLLNLRALHSVTVDGEKYTISNPFDDA